MRNLFIKDTCTSSQLIYTYIGKIINKYLRDTTHQFPTIPTHSNAKYLSSQYHNKEKAETI